MEQPKKRGPLRLFLGAAYYTFRRRLQWAFGGARFAARQPGPGLPYVQAAHETPLLRRLKDVDMRLQHNKVTNLKLAVARLNGTLLRPGETLSYWRAIGRPTAAQGYLPGMVLQNGRVGEGVGGGLCQLSNLVYWLTLHTPLTVVERHRHGYDVFPDANRTQPFGSGATCFYNYIDLVIRNDTPHPYQLQLEVGPENLAGRWLSDVPAAARYRVYEAEHWFQQEAWGGYSRHNVLRRKKLDDAGRELADEPVAENHAVMMYSPLLPP